MKKLTLFAILALSACGLQGEKIRIAAPTKNELIEQIKKTVSAYCTKKEQEGTITKVENQTTALPQRLYTRLHHLKKGHHNESSIFSTTKKIKPKHRKQVYSIEIDTDDLDNLLQIPTLKGTQDIIELISSFIDLCKTQT